ncbi:transmembrane protein 116-like isoform X2 [Antedon mediterranea]
MEPYNHIASNLSHVVPDVTFMAQRFHNRCLVYDEENEELLLALRYIHIVFASLSIIGASSTIIYSIIKGVVTSEEVRPLFHLSLADLGLAICWVIGAAVWNDDKDDSEGCVYLQAITEAFHVSTFFLTVNYSLNVYVRIKDRQNRAMKLSTLMSSIKMKWGLRMVYVLSWLLPIIIMIPIVYYHETVDLLKCYRCLLLFYRPSVQSRDEDYDSWWWENYGAIFFVISLGLSMIIIIVFYLLSIKVFRILIKQNMWTDAQRDAVRSMRIRITFYILVFLYCWIPAFCLGIIDLASEKKISVSDYSVLYILQGITAPSQGFLNCIVYGWTRPTFRKIGRRANAGNKTLLSARTYRVYGTGAQKKWPKHSSKSESTTSLQPERATSPKVRSASMSRTSSRCSTPSYSETTSYDE